jgi:hypothetical protein
MTARRITALPILLLGGLIVVAANLAAVGAGLYYEYQGVKMMLDGDVVNGIVVMGFVAMAASAVVSILAIPGGLLMGLGEKVWGPDKRPVDEII